MFGDHAKLQTCICVHLSVPGFDELLPRVWIQRSTHTTRWRYPSFPFFLLIFCYDFCSVNLSVFDCSNLQFLHSFFCNFRKPWRVKLPFTVKPTSQKVSTFLITCTIDWHRDGENLILQSNPINTQSYS